VNRGSAGSIADLQNGKIFGGGMYYESISKELRTPVRAYLVRKRPTQFLSSDRHPRILHSSTISIVINSMLTPPNPPHQHPHPTLAGTWCTGGQVRCGLDDADNRSDLQDEKCESLCSDHDVLQRHWLFISGP
jgi:hypothetical protein